MLASSLRRARPTGLRVAFAFVLSLGLVMVTTTPASAASEVIYDSMPSPLPANYRSVAFQAEQTAEFGDHVTLGATQRQLDSITVGLSSWACEAGNWSIPSGSGSCVSTPGSTFTHPITLKIFAVNPSDSTLPGALLTSKTTTFAIPYRPTTDPVNCPPVFPATTTTKYLNGAVCSNGLGFTLDFDLSATHTVLPNDIIVTIAYNTDSWGASPLGVSGPYSSLNVGQSQVAPTVGAEDGSRAFWNTANAAYYGDGGVTGTLREVLNSPQLGTYGGLLMTIRASATRAATSSGAPEAPATTPAASTSAAAAAAAAAASPVTLLAETGIDTGTMSLWTWTGGGVLTAGVMLIGLAAFRRKRVQSS